MDGFRDSKKLLIQFTKAVHVDLIENERRDSNHKGRNNY